MNKGNGHPTGCPPSRYYWIKRDGDPAQHQTNTMDHFTTTAQIEEMPIDITWMSDEELAALLEVTVDQLLGLEVE